MSVASKRISVNGVELAYAERGGGDPVLLVHGSLNDLRSWSAIQAALAARYRVIVPSRRYHWPNATPGEADRYAIADHVADLAALIEALDVAPARLVGASYGAMTVLTLAVTRPELARAIVLGEPPLLPWLDRSPEGSALREAFVAAAWDPAGEAGRRGDAETMVRRFIDGVAGQGTFGRLPPLVQASMLDNAPEMAIELRTPPDVYFPDLTCDDLRRVRLAALLLNGESSPRMFHLIQDALAACLPGAERVKIPNASHAIHLGNPRAYSETVLGFLDRH